MEHAVGPVDLCSAHLSAVPDIAAAAAAELAAIGPQARVCVLPEGPQTIPFRRAGDPVAAGPARS